MTTKDFNQINRYIKENSSITEDLFSIDILPFTYTISGKHHSLQASATNAYANVKDITFTSCKTDKNCVQITYNSQADNLQVDVYIELFKGYKAVKQHVVITNTGEKPVFLTGVSSVFSKAFDVEDISELENIKLMYCRQSWQGEGQWHEDNLEELGINYTGVNPPTTAFCINSQSSHTTSKYYPLVFLRSKEKDKCFYCEILPEGGWYIETEIRRFWEQKQCSLYINSGGANERLLKFSKKLEQNQSYKTAACIYGFGDYCLDNSVKELYKARRAINKRNLDNTRVFYNDYMNCLWASPDKDKTIKLIEAAAQAGCQAYVIDAGWFIDERTNWDMLLGDWETSSNRFGDKGLKGIIDIIHSYNMMAGVWFEIEVAGEKSKIYSMPDDWYIIKNGLRVGGGSRVFFNFSNKEACSYLAKKMQTLIDMGIRFIKNDYNDSYCFADIDGEEQYGLQKNLLAFYDFIDDLCKKNPHLIIENCASGALRSDRKALSYFHMQSVSDQEDYRLYPSIIKGTLICSVPEQTGIWCMPYPVRFNERNIQDFAETEDFLNKFTDGEETIFNIVNSLCSVMYLTGRIDKSDSLNKELILSGVKTAKELFDFIKNCYPQVDNLYRVSNKQWDYLFLTNEDNSQKLLYVWRLDSKDDNIQIDITGYVAEQIFPSNSFATIVNQDNNKLTLNFKNKYNARLYKLVKI